MALQEKASTLEALEKNAEKVRDRGDMLVQGWVHGWVQEWDTAVCLDIFSANHSIFSLPGLLRGVVMTPACITCLQHVAYWHVQAGINYKLAAALSAKIAQKQSVLMAGLRTGSSASSPAGKPEMSSTLNSQVSSGSTVGAGMGAGGYNGGSRSARALQENAPKWKWQQSLEEARARLSQEVLFGRQ
jgi:hypothetical protein